MKGYENSIWRRYRVGNKVKKLIWGIWSCIVLSIL